MWCAVQRAGRRGSSFVCRQTCTAPLRPNSGAQAGGRAHLGLLAVPTYADRWKSFAVLIAGLLVQSGLQQDAARCNSISVIDSLESRIKFQIGDSMLTL